MEPANCALG